MDLDLKDVHILVTGASGGIGLAIIQTFVEQGAKVTAHYNTTLATLSTLLSQHPHNLQAIQADLTQESSVYSLFSDAQKAFGVVQVVIVNHAIYETKPAPLVDMELDQWKKTLDVNLTSSFLVTREYLRGLKSASEGEREKAAVVFIGSTAGKYGEAGHADYAASKSAMMYGLTMSLKNEIVKIAPRGRVNTVAPGWVKTPMAEESLKDANIMYSALATMPLRKVATPQDVANQVAVLSSGKLSGHITGQVLMIEGGMEGRLLNTPSDLGLEL